MFFWVLTYLCLVVLLVGGEMYFRYLCFNLYVCLFVILSLSLPVFLKGERFLLPL